MTTWTGWRSLPAPRITLAMVVLSACALAASLTGVEATFNLVAHTEVVHCKTDAFHRAAWRFEGVEMARGPERNRSLFTGSVTVLPNTRVRFERRGKGKLYIRIEADGPETPVARLHAPDERLLGEVRGRLLLRLAAPAGGDPEGPPPVYRFQGSAQVGGGGDTPALLRGGRLSMLGHGLFGRQVYRGGEVSLELGDRVEVTRAMGAAGLVVVDAGPALQVAYRAIGRNAQVTRFAARGFAVEVSLLTRIANDPWLQSLWAGVVFLFGLRRALLSEFGPKTPS